MAKIAPEMRRYNVNRSFISNVLKAIVKRVLHKAFRATFKYFSLFAVQVIITAPALVK